MTKDQQTDSQSNKGGRWPTTHWSVIIESQSSAEATREEALRTICEKYWNPIFQYIRWRQRDFEDASDLTQEFFIAWVEKGLFSGADPSRGRFRNYLLRSINNFLANAHRDRHTQRRFPRGGFIAASTTASGADPLDSIASDSTPEAAFRKAWLHALIERVGRKLENRLRDKGKDVHFEIFHHRIIDPILNGVEPHSQRDLANRFGITEKDVANRLLSVRRTYQDLLLTDIKDYAFSHKDTKAEVDDLLQFVSEI